MPSRSTNWRTCKPLDRQPQNRTSVFSGREHPSVTVQDCLEIRMETYNLQDIRQYITQELDLVGMSPYDARAFYEAIVQS